jgi:hypothetical protein
MSDVMRYPLQPNTLEQWFSTFSDSRYPYLVIEQFGGTPRYNLLKNNHQVQNWLHP